MGQTGRPLPMKRDLGPELQMDVVVMPRCLAPLETDGVRTDP